jgi:folate-dependent tRNA-U54 methylase TrmFO/GidA
MADVTVIGGGLAGCEAAWQLAEAGFHGEQIFEILERLAFPCSCWR